MPAAFESALRIAQTLIQDEAADGPITTEMIAAKVDQTLSMNQRWRNTVDREALVKELETRFSVWIGRETFLSSDDGHVAWLNEARKSGWRYWPRYMQWLEGQWSSIAIGGLDRFTDRIVGLLEDPNRTGSWDRRGLVVGHVQSGKTSNYTGLICKAADAGYKIIIVLAGLHKNLRSQTQMRLDEGFLGYETLPVGQAAGRELREIGVGRIDSDTSIRPDYVTHRADDGDFRRAVANNMGISPGHRPWLFVVKKNPSVLRNLISWVEDRVADTHDSATGRPIVQGLPLLVVDDEADHASVDTGDQTFDEAGQPDPDYEPKTINRLIRRLLFIFEKSAYVGYTATPFANIFIHERGLTTEYGEDLFPRSFIVGLPTPSNYSGPVRIFGLAPGLDGTAGTEPLPLVQNVSDHAASRSLRERVGWMPPLHRNGHTPIFNGQDTVPLSLRRALLSFLISCAVRRYRGEIAAHNSMLVHVTRFANVQHEVTRQVLEYLDVVKMKLRRATADRELLESLQNLWSTDFIPTNHSVALSTGDQTLRMPDWTTLLGLLPSVAADIHVREINGTAGDILDYDVHRATGFNVVAIGGDKLARGLTLEGLTVSYFLRASKMYDTLMQMGRWFGYRPGYLDLCRLYTTADLADWFEHITEASEELRQEFDHMAAVGGTPRDYGLKVKSHPLLLVTSRVKMRNAEQLQLKFAGEVQETVVFHRDPRVLEVNAQAAGKLLSRLGQPIVDPRQPRPNGRSHEWRGARLWNGAPGAVVADFLRDFRTHEAAVKVNAPLLAEYIDKQMGVGELTEWTIALLSGEGSAGRVGNYNVATVERASNTRSYDISAQKQMGRYMIRRLLAPRDEAIDLDAASYEAALNLAIHTFDNSQNTSRASSRPTEPSGPSIRHIRGLGDVASNVRAHPERGLLLIYPLSASHAEIDFDGPVIGFGLSFPESTRAESVTYSVNNVYWAQEFGEDL
ncbi:MAG: Z1 domain-containing protein [Reyranella sp.]|nr:Z1 domain-containing protein [Reyranella sp.]